MVLAGFASRESIDSTPSPSGRTALANKLGDRRRSAAVIASDDRLIDAAGRCALDGRAEIALALHVV
jgi:hypothetical protein